jgi:predicted GNAT family acetyltransferase
VVQMLDDGGDPALSGPAPAFSDTDPTTLRKTPDPADPLSAKAAPETPWWDLTRYAPAAPPPPKIAPWMTKSPQVNPEQRKRDSSRFDPTIIDSLFGSGVGRLSPNEQKIEQDKRRAAATQADLVNRMLKEQEKTLRGGNPNPYDGTTFRGTNVPMTTAGDRNVADKKAKAEGPEATLKQWRDVTERSLQSFLNGLVAVPKGFAIGVDAQRYLLGQILHGNPNITPNAVVETLDRVSNDIRQALPGDPTRNDELISQLGQGGGSMASFLMGGAVAKALGLPAKVGLAINGGYVGGTQAYDEAIAFGADAPTRYLSFLIGTGLGMTEMIPIDRALSRLNIAGEGVVARIVAGAMANSLEEMIQEVGQQIGQNTMARVLYDNSRDIFEGVGDAAVVSAILGGMFGGGATAVNAVVQRIGASQKPPQAVPPGAVQSEQGAAGTPPTDSATPATGKLNDMAGPLAGTVVEVLEKTDDGSGYMVRTPDGQVTFTGVQTLDVAAAEEETSQQAAAPADQTQTDEFKRWFGESKVVGEGGAPLVVYHGTDADFSTFERTEDIGFHFGDKAAANERAELNADGANVMPAFLALKNPYRMDDLFTWEPDRVVDHLAADGIIGEQELARFDAGEIEVDRTQVKTWLQAKGYDGVVYGNAVEGAGESYIAFDPTQIKSATGNVGTFDPSNPDISQMRSPERPRAPYPLERTRPAGGIPEQAAQSEVTPAKVDITTRFKDAIDLVVKQGRFGQGNSKAEAIYKWGQSVARVKSQGQMLELFHEGGHHLHSRLEPILDKAIDKHTAEIFRIADTLYGGGGQLKMSDIVARRREGFATFFQVYMNNPAEARVIAPGFLPDFEKLMEENSPGIKSELDAIRKDVDAWLTSKSSAQLARERVVSNKKLGTVGKIVESVKNGTLLHDTATLANRVYQATLNDQHPITLAVRQLRRAAEENIRTQIERGLLNRQQAEAELARLDRRGFADPVKMAALARNSYNASSETIATGVAKYRSDGAAVTKGIPEILQTAMGAGRFRLDPQVYDDFNTYLAMRRIVTEWKNYYATLAWDRAQNFGAAALNPNAPEPAIKRYRRPDDVSLGDAQQAIADLERGNPSFAAGARDLYDYLDALLQYKVDAGIITQEMADMQRQIADYVPLRREMDDTKSGSLGNSKDARTGKDNLVRVFKGSDRRILSPIESVMQMTHETMALVAKNDVKRAMVDMALDIGRGSGAIVEKIPSTAMKGTGVKLSEVIKAAGDFSLAEEVAQAMGRDEITMREFMDEVLDGDEVATIWRKADISEKGEPIIYTWRNGEMEAYTLNDQEWADDLYTALTELGREQTNMAIQILGKPAAFVRAGVTSAPPFLIANIVRDQLASWVLNDGVYPVVSLGKGMASDLADRKARRLYNLSMANIGGSNIAALDKTRFGTEQTMLAKAGVGVTVEQSLSTALRVVDASETWSRQGIWQAAYKKALADGLSPADAMIEAGFEATDYANYGRAGSKMLLARRLITFLNANLQGLDKSLRTALGGEGGAAFLRKELAPWVRRQISPAFAARLGFEGSTTSLPLTPMEKKQRARAGRTMTKMAMLAIPSALLAMLYWDDEEYQEMSPYMKGTRWMIKLEPGKWLAIPKPFQLATFATFVEYAIDSVIGGDATAMQKFIESQAAVVAPPYENPGIKLFYELAANKNLFTDREIVPNHVAARPAWLQYDEYTSEFGKLIGRFTGTSPMVVDHVITSSFATWGRGFLSASNQLNSERQSQGLDDFAFTSYFVKDGSRSSTVRPAFFNLVGQTNGKLKGAYDGYKQLMDAGAEGQADQLLSQLSEDQRAFALLYYHQEVDAKRLHPLRNAYDIVQTISGMRKEIAFNRLREGGKDDGEIITLSPSQQKMLSDRLSDLQVRLQRNALIATGEAGFAQRQILPTLPLVDQIKAIDPRVATDLKARLGSRVYTTDVVAELWPAVKAEILGKGAKANLKPFVLKAKGAGRKIWTGAKP